MGESGLLAENQTHDEGKAEDEQERRVRILDHLATAFVTTSHVAKLSWFWRMVLEKDDMDARKGTQKQQCALCEKWCLSSNCRFVLGCFGELMEG